MPLDFDLESEVKDDIQVPRDYRVIFHNDDYTEFHFVIYVVMEVFSLPYDSAEMFAASVHKSGNNTVGVFRYEIAEMKTHEVM